MEIKGTLDFDPVILATGKDRSRIIRRHSQMIASLVRPFVPHLQGSVRRRANQLDKLLYDDPNYWIRRKDAVSTTDQLENLFGHAKDILQLEVSQQYPELLKLLRKTINKVQEDFVLTRQRPGWAILRIDKKYLIPHLDNIRSDGTQISCSAWGPHISVVRGETSHWKTRQKQAYNGKTYSVTLSDKLRSNRKGYYWVDCQSKELEKLRMQLGLPPRPSPPFHLTIGKKR